LICKVSSRLSLCMF